MDEGNGTGTSLQESPRQEVGVEASSQCPACAAGRPVNPDGTHTIDRNIIPCPDGDKCQLCKGPILTRYQYAMALESHFRAKLLRLMARWDRGSLKYGPLCLKGCTRKSWVDEREDEFDDSEAYHVIDLVAKRVLATLGTGG